MTGAKVVCHGRSATVIRFSRRGLALIQFDDTGKTQWEAPQALEALPAAVALGRLGGRATSPAKVEAARANGRLGGRPRYVPPSADSTEPLDEVQRAIVEILVARTVQRIKRGK